MDFFPSFFFHQMEIYLYGILNLKCVHFSEGLETIGKEAFYECKSLEKMTFPKSLQKIGQFSFFCCDSLKKVKIPGNVKTIEYKAFAGCDNLTDQAFYNSLLSGGVQWEPLEKD